MMESYSLPTDSPLAKPGISQQSSLSSKLPYTPHPLQTGRKSSHDELEIPAPKPSLSTDEKRREEKNMEEKARFSKLGNALQQQKSASSTKLLPPSYRNDPMRYVINSYRCHLPLVGIIIFSWLHYTSPTCSPVREFISTDFCLVLPTNTIMD